MDACDAVAKDTANRYVDGHDNHNGEDNGIRGIHSHEHSLPSSKWGDGPGDGEEIASYLDDE